LSCPFHALIPPPQPLPAEFFIPAAIRTAAAAAPSAKPSLDKACDPNQATNRNNVMASLTSGWYREEKARKGAAAKAKAKEEAGLAAKNQTIAELEAKKNHKGEVFIAQKDDKLDALNARDEELLGESRGQITPARKAAIAVERKLLSDAIDKVRGDCQDQLASLETMHAQSLEERRLAEKAKKARKRENAALSRERKRRKLLSKASSRRKQEGAVEMLGGKPQAKKDHDNDNGDDDDDEEEEEEEEEGKAPVPVVRRRRKVAVVVEEEEEEEEGEDEDEEEEKRGKDSEQEGKEGVSKAPGAPSAQKKARDQLTAMM
jgi:hypothetical protein